MNAADLIGKPEAEFGLPTIAPNDPLAGFSDEEIDAMLADSADFDRMLYEAAFPASLRSLHGAT